MMHRFRQWRENRHSERNPPRETGPVATLPNSPYADTDSSLSKMKVLHDCPKATVDICFVHGLTGDRESTWTADGLSTPWPKTLLPAKLDKARILTYGYDAYVVRISVASANRLIDHATNLLTKLTTDRCLQNASSRPLIFVAHSLGGLVCKEAILLSRNNPESHLRGIFHCIKGVIFMGTPHRGSWMADWAKIPASAIGIVKSTNRSLLEILETNNQYLESIQFRFSAMLRQQRERGRLLEVTCFLEALPLPVAGQVVCKESAILEGFTCITIHANHRNMVKFSSAEDSGFQMLLGELIRWESQVGHLQPLWVVPFGRNKDFVGRESTLAQLLKTIPPSADKDDCQRAAVEGLGGVGKTQVALEAAFRVRDEHPECHVFWVPAVDVTTFENAYRELGRQLKIAGIDDDKADVKLLVKTALSQSADNWLLIVDNADDVELMFGTAGATPLCDYLPSSYRGSILFTTRNHEAVVRLDIPQRNLVNLAEMSRLEAVDLLRRNVAAHQLSDTQSTATLLDFLTDLPLAIKQASAYMAKTGITAMQYLNYCQSGNERLIELLSKDFEDRARYRSTRNPVAATWLVSFVHISRDNRLAAQYLRFMSFLAEKEIPKTLLPPGNSVLEAYEAIGTLKAYAFITERAGQGSYDIHRLVRLAMRNWLAEKGELRVCATTVMQQLDKLFPYPEHENMAVWMRYLPHTLAALELREHLPDDVIKSSLLSRVADSHFMLGKYQIAEELHRQALQLRTQVLVVEHPDTLTSINHLALVLRSQGKYEEAETMHRQALKLQTQVLGTEHPNTLTSMNNLAIVLSEQGKYEEAKRMHKQALKLQTQVLGAEHPDMLASMNNLAYVLGKQGKYEEAETIHRQALQLWTQVLGAEHPDTLASMNNLAFVLGNQGKYEEAAIMYRQALQLRIQVLGAEHPDTLGSMSNLANVLGWQGKYEETATMHRQALQLWIQGKYEEAETMHRQALQLRTQVLGAEHPDTLSSMSNLAFVLGNQGKYNEAERIHKQEPIPVPYPSSEVVTTEQSFSRNTAPEATRPEGGRTNSQPRDTTGFKHN
ncbi:kinesin light chain [Parachaetomium inaequale]|uniref:Kinesin light chain n=1 Tax=Parachaetomium inaequale TaxID=2588326 RepID=A0AAN6P4W6_9PEZI|nr:kinesin light chain [Parachaetomium inaequale]